MSRCCQCNTEFVKIDYFYESTVYHCPHHCHYMIEHFDSRREESFFMPIETLDGYQITLTIRNISEPIIENNLRKTIKYCIVQDNGWELFRYEDYIMPYGLSKLPFDIFLYKDSNWLKRNYYIPNQLIYNQFFISC